jgi:hypothetical protein
MTMSPDHLLTASGLNGSVVVEQRRLHQAAIDEMQFAVGMGGDGTVVGGDHQRDAQFCPQPFEQIQNLRASTGVEVAGRLVGHQQRWFRHECARDRHALLLAATQLVRQVVDAIR